MKGSLNQQHLLRTLLFGLVALAGVGLTGCQIETGGQTLPSPYYMKDDVQYFPPAAEMKLSKEAAAMKAYNQDQAMQASRQQR